MSQTWDKRLGYYNAYLNSVDAPEGVTNVVVDGDKSEYEDSLIRVVWKFVETQAIFDMVNKTSQTIKIIWDEAGYVNYNGNTERVLHKGVKIIDREKSQIPTLIYKNTTLTDFVAPISYTQWVSGSEFKISGWESMPLFPKKFGALSKKIEYYPEILDKDIRIILPIMVDGNTLEYSFNFKTEFVSTEKKRK